MKARHKAQIKEYPHTPVARGEPYTGVEWITTFVKVWALQVKN